MTSQFGGKNFGIPLGCTVFYSFNQTANVNQAKITEQLCREAVTMLFFWNSMSHLDFIQSCIPNGSSKTYVDNILVIF